MKKITLFIFAAVLMSAAIATSCWKVTLPEEPAVLVGNQEGTLTAGVPGVVTFPVVTANIAGGSYTVSVADLPTGMSVSGNVTISSDNGTLTLTGNTTTVAGVYSNLILHLDDTPSPPFTLAISSPSLESVTVVWSNTSLAYSSTPQAPTATAVTSLGESLPLIVTGAQTAAGSGYTANGRLADRFAQHDPKFGRGRQLQQLFDQPARRTLAHH